MGGRSPPGAGKERSGPASHAFMQLQFLCLASRASGAGHGGVAYLSPPCAMLHGRRQAPQSQYCGIGYGPHPSTSSQSGGGRSTIVDLHFGGHCHQQLVWPLQLLVVWQQHLGLDAHGCVLTLGRGDWKLEHWRKPLPTFASC